MAAAAAAATATFDRSPYQYTAAYAYFVCSLCEATANAFFLLLLRFSLILCDQRSRCFLLVLFSCCRSCCSFCLFYSFAFIFVRARFLSCTSFSSCYTFVRMVRSFEWLSNALYVDLNASYYTCAPLTLTYGHTIEWASTRVSVNARRIGVLVRFNENGERQTKNDDDVENEPREKKGKEEKNSFFATRLPRSMYVCVCDVRLFRVHRENGALGLCLMSYARTSNYDGDDDEKAKEKAKNEKRIHILCFGSPSFEQFIFFAFRFDSLFCIFCSLADHRSFPLAREERKKNERDLELCMCGADGKAERRVLTTNGTVKNVCKWSGRCWRQRKISRKFFCVWGPTIDARLRAAAAHSVYILCLSCGFVVPKLVRYSVLFLPSPPPPSSSSQLN